MATDFSAHLLQSIVNDVSETRGTGFQNFELRRDEIGGMAAVQAASQGFLTPAQIAQLEGLRNPNQIVELHTYNQVAPGTGATRVRRGAGSPTVSLVIPSFFAVIEEGIDMSLINHSLRAYGDHEEKQDVIRRAYEDHLNFILPEKLKNMYKRANTQFINWIEATKWDVNALADKGTIFAAGLDGAKEVPLAAHTSFFQDAQIEARQNNFLQAGRPVALASALGQRVFNKYAEYGSANERNLDQFTGWFDPYFDNEITPDAAAESAIYLISRGGIGFYNRVMDYTVHPDYNPEKGYVEAGIDRWYKPIEVGAGTLNFPNLPNMKIEIKATVEHGDTSATYGTDEAKNDIVSTWSLVTQFGALSAYSNAGETPIIRYDLQKA